MHCGIFIKDGYHPQKQRSVIRRLQRNLARSIKDKDAPSYACVRVLPSSNARIMSEAERTAQGLNTLDAIIIAQSLPHQSNEIYGGLIEDIRIIRKAHPNSLIALHLSLNPVTAYEFIRSEFAQDAHEVGASVIFSEPLDQTATCHKFKTMLDLALTQRSSDTIATKDFRIPAQQASVTLGDYTIVKMADQKHPRAYMIETKTRRSITCLRPGQLSLLWGLAAYKNTVVSQLDQWNTHYGFRADDTGEELVQAHIPTLSARDLNLHFMKISEGLEAAGIGKVHLLWNNGRMVRDSDWRSKAAQPTGYPIIYSPEDKTLSWGERRITLGPKESVLAQALFEVPGTTIVGSTIFPDTSFALRAKYTRWLRRKIDVLAPNIPDFGLMAIETLNSYGYRLRTIPEIQALLTQRQIRTGLLF